ncbi:MAG: hypothetical protein QXX30_00970 [Candidatus Aenigmatarchaeota archaeon]
MIKVVISEVNKNRPVPSFTIIQVLWINIPEGQTFTLDNILEAVKPYVSESAKIEKTYHNGTSIDIQMIDKDIDKLYNIRIYDIISMLGILKYS